MAISVRGRSFRWVGMVGSEQAYRNFKGKGFWLVFNEYLVRKVLNGKFLAIAVDLVFFPNYGKEGIGWTFLVGLL